jgi:two-component system, chemotaxis family, protein-glutamate methylesterase/glutaminase
VTEPDRVIVIGASAGGVDALTRFVRALPRGASAAVLVVLHLSSRAPSALARILDRACTLRVVQVARPERLEAGTVYVGPPDRHLVVVDGMAVLSEDQRENGHRPAVNPLFRSAARHWGHRTVAVVLSGVLDDGARGAVLVRGARGRVLVQDPGTALYSDMPRFTMAAVEVDGTGSPEDLAAAALAIPLDPSPPDDTVPQTEDVMRTTTLTCPDCGGVMNEVGEHPLALRCQIGHEWSGNGLLASQGERLEEAIVVALRTLEERRDLLARLRDDAATHGRMISARRFAGEYEDLLARIDVLRKGLALELESAAGDG